MSAAMRLVQWEASAKTELEELVHCLFWRGGVTGGVTIPIHTAWMR